ncbi:MAG: polysaccharide biosynthesis C-terminal domain-containing protein [Pseudomonadota bacterium]
MSFGRQAVASVALAGLYALLAMAITIAATRWLGVEGYGLYASVLAHISLLAVLVAGGLPMLIVREAVAADSAGDLPLLRRLIERARLWVLGVSLAIAAIGTLVWALGRPDPAWWAVFWPALGVMAGLGLLEAQGAALRALGQPVAGQVPAALIRPGLHLALFLGLAAWAGGIAPVTAMAAFLGAVLVALGASTMMLTRQMAARRRAQPGAASRRKAREGASRGETGDVASLRETGDVASRGGTRDGASPGQTRDMASRDEARDMASRDEARNVASRDEMRERASRGETLDGVSPGEARDVGSRDEAWDGASRDERRGVAVPEEAASVELRDGARGGSQNRSAMASDIGGSGGADQAEPKDTPNGLRAPSGRLTDRLWLRALLTLMLAGGAVRANQHLGGVMLEHLSDRREVALFQPVVQMTLLVLLGRQAITAVLAPRLKRSLLAGAGPRSSEEVPDPGASEPLSAPSLPAAQLEPQRLMSLAGLAMLGTAVLAGGALLALGPSGMAAIFGAGFEGLYPVLAVMIGGQILALTLGHPLVALNQAGEERAAARVLAAALALNLALGLALIPSLGALGAAWAAALSQVAAALALARTCQARLQLRSDVFAVLRRR